MIWGKGSVNREHGLRFEINYGKISPRILNIKELAMKKILLMTAMAGILLAGCGKTQSGTSNQATSGQTGEQKSTEQSQGTKEDGFTGSLKAAVALGVPMKCTYKIGDMEAEGYIKGQKYRGVMNNQGKKGEVIVKDNCMWSWAEGEGQGVKICFEASESDKMWDDPGNAQASDKEVESDSPEMEYKCAPAVFGDDKFNPPANITFIDPEQMMKDFKLPDNLPTGGEE